jgi:acetyl esterase/lipase
MIDFARVDPELVDSLGAVKERSDALDLHDIPGTRARLAEMDAAARQDVPDLESVRIEDRLVPGPSGAPDVHVRVYQPVDRPETLPALLWIHGGGYVIGSAEGDDLLAEQVADEVRCVVVSVDYRLAPEHPFPAPVEDCYAALKWLAASADVLGVDRSRIAIGGASAGGGLAAGLALLARDRAEVPVRFQLLIYPMLDDRNVELASDRLPDHILWTRERNLIGWRSYLGRAPGGADVPGYAAAARATDLSGLPPAFVMVGDVDLFLMEDVEYARRMMASGVPTELHVYPGAFHGFFSMGPDASVSQRFTAECLHVLRRALHG